MPRNMKRMGTGGFTMVELMVVVAIVGILAVVAIPQFSEYRQRGLNASALSDLMNLSSSQAMFYVDRWMYAATHDHGDGDVQLDAIKTQGDLLEGSSDSSRVLAQFVSDTHYEAPLSLGNQVLIQANTSTGGISFVAASKHSMGNTLYGTGSETSITYRDLDSLGPGQGDGGEELLSDYLPKVDPKNNPFADPDAPGEWQAM